jgi:replication initiation and membrane attachment protein
MKPMAQHWQEMLPVDRYEVTSNGLLYEYDRKVLTLLYQPLIGPIAYSLYMTLWSQIDENRLTADGSSHHALMNVMDSNLKQIYDARLKLEGIGLLSTYVRTEEGLRSFVYEIKPPITPSQFFLDGMLNVYLYRKVGKNQFLKLKRFFSDEHFLDKEKGYENVTRSFQEVFDSAVPGSPSSHMVEDLRLEEQRVYLDRATSETIKVDEEHFDFELLYAGLSEVLVPKRAINKKVREAIAKLSFLYGIDPIQMKNIVISAVDESNEIQIDELRKSARDWYQLNYSDQLPLLIDKIQPLPHVTKVEEPKTQEEKLVHYLEKTSPRQLLIDISGGGEPAKSDLQIVEDVMFQQKLLPGVVNVLIQYVLLKTDMKLTKAYVDKIASHWARKKVQTVSEAMDLAKKEHRQYLDWAEGKQNTAQTAKPNARKKAIRTESLPDWFDKNEEPTDQKSSGNKEMEEKKRALQEKLKRFKS